MKKKEFTVIHLIETVEALDRAGAYAGQTSVARLAKITSPRARRKLKEATKIGLLFAYRNKYRPNISRWCYSLTETGASVLETVRNHKETTIWRLSDE